MKTEQILAEIREANLSYLMLAQKLVRSDPAAAPQRLGVSAETASLIAALSPGQMLKVAAGNTLLCRFRMEDDDDLVWGLIAHHVGTPAVAAAHSASSSAAAGRQPLKRPQAL